MTALPLEGPVRGFSTRFSGGFRRPRRVSSSDVFDILGLPRAGVELLLEGSSAHLTSGAVDTWRDASGLGRDVTQASAGNRPSTTTIGGRAALAFTGASYLDRSAFALTGTHTVIVVGSASPQTTKVFVDSSGSSPATRSIVYGYATNSIGVSGKTGQSVIGPVSLTSAKLLVTQFSGSTSFCRVNRIAYPASAVAGEGYSGITVGSSYAHSAGLTGSIALVAIYSRALSTAETTRLEDSIISYYAIT